MNRTDAYRTALTTNPDDREPSEMRALDAAILRATDRTLDIPDCDLPQYLTRSADEIIEIALDAERDELYVVADPSVRSADFKMLLDAICADLPRLGALGFEALARKAWASSGLDVCEDEVGLLDHALMAFDAGDTSSNFDIFAYGTQTEIQLRAGERRVVKYTDGAFVCEEEAVSSDNLHDFLTTLAEKIAAGRAMSGAER